MLGEIRADEPHAAPSSAWGVFPSYIALTSPHRRVRSDMSDLHKKTGLQLGLMLKATVTSA